MEQALLIDRALKVIFCDDDIENGRHPELFRGLFASGDHDIAFAIMEAHLATNLDISLDRVVDSLARRNPSAACELVGVAKVVNRLRQSKEVRFTLFSFIFGLFFGVAITALFTFFSLYYGTGSVAKSRGQTGHRNIRTRRASHATGRGQEGAEIVCDCHEQLNRRKVRTRVYFASLSGSQFCNNT
jgi:hypothetical protein